MGLPDIESPCGRHSIRINPRGQIIPCVYWRVAPSDGPTIADLPGLKEELLNLESFRAARSKAPTPQTVPVAVAAPTGEVSTIIWMRMMISVRGVKAIQSNWQWNPAPAKDLMRIGNVCATIVI